MKDFMNTIFSPEKITSIIIVVIVVVLLFILHRSTIRYKKTNGKEGERASALRLLFDVLRAVIVIAAAILILKINGINVVSLITGLGIASAVIGLAMQDFIKDVINGLYMVLYHFYSVGECVEYNGREGVILSINLKTTKIGDMEDHSVWTICNRNIIEIRRIAKRMDIDLPLSYEEDPKTVRSVLCTVCQRIESGIEAVTKCDFLGTQSFESSAILYKIRIYCEPKDRPDVRRAALAVIQDVLGDAGISIPYNQVDVHLDTKITEH